MMLGQRKRTKTRAGVAIGATALVGVIAATTLVASAGEGTAPADRSDCTVTPIVIGGVDMGCLPDHLFVFADGRDDANWQASSKGYVGDVAVRGTVAKERSSGSFAYAGTIVTDDSTLSKWEQIVENNIGQATAELAASGRVNALVDDLEHAIAQIGALPVTPGFERRSPGSLDGLDTTNGRDEVLVIDITDDMKVKQQIAISGDPGDVFILRWDSDADPSNGLDGKVKFQSGGAIVPAGGLGPANFVHVAGDINASGGGETPPPPYPQGPRTADGDGSLIDGGKDFRGGGFFTGYWLTTGQPGKGKTSSLSNAVFVGGWYTLSTKFSLTSGTSGVHVAPPVPGSEYPSDPDHAA